MAQTVGPGGPGQGEGAQTEGADGPDGADGDQGPLLSVPIIRALVGTYMVSAVGSAMVGVAVAFVAYQRSRSIVLTVTVLTPIGGLAIGAATDALSIWWALAFSGLAITGMSLLLRTRLTVFDELEPVPVDERRHRPAHGYHWVVSLLSSELLHHAIANVYHPPEPRTEPGTDATGPIATAPGTA